MLLQDSYFNIALCGDITKVAQLHIFAFKS